MWDRLSQRERVMVLVLIFFLIATLYYIYIYKPTVDELSDLENQIINKQTKLANAISFTKQLPEMKKKYQALKSLEESYDIVNRGPEESFNLIEIIADKTNVKIISYLPQESEEIVTFNFVVEGNFNSINSFLKGLRNLEGQLKFSKFLIQSNDKLLQMSAELIYEKNRDISGDNV